MSRGAASLVSGLSLLFLGLLPGGAHAARFDCAAGTGAAGGNFSPLDAPSLPFAPHDVVPFNDRKRVESRAGSYPVGLGTFLLRAVRSRLGDPTGIPLTLSQIAALPELSQAEDIRARAL